MLRGFQSIGRSLLAETCLKSHAVRYCASNAASYPRAAVAVTIRCDFDKPADGIISVPNYYLLIQRANPPDQGKWSLLGGKIELGEATMDAARREFSEEVIFDQEVDCSWCNRPFMTTDAIVPNKDGGFAFHYMIAQTFCSLQEDVLPSMSPADDAMDARWWTLSEIRADEGDVSVGVLAVIETAEKLYQRNALDLH